MTPRKGAPGRYTGALPAKVSVGKTRRRKLQRSTVFFSSSTYAIC
jgi:hypothetical protein